MFEMRAMNFMAVFERPIRVFLAYSASFGYDFAKVMSVERPFRA